MNASDDAAHPLDASAPDGPAWWRAACADEYADRLDAAEERIRSAVPHLGFASSIAELYARRMRRFLREGNRSAAQVAFERAQVWMRNYASFATSGGEGAALSLERDEFLDELQGEWQRALDAGC